MQQVRNVWSATAAEAAPDPSQAPVSLREIPSSQPDNRLLMIYVHIPFCRSKCHFCDWVQPIPKSDLLLTAEDQPRRSYIDSLCREIHARGEALSQAGYIPYIVYWGGGTASILTESEIRAVGGALHEAFDLSRVAEATIECSPDTISVEKLHIFRDIGFNRFSSGVQSLDDDRLRHLGRMHNSDMAFQAVHWATEAGFDDINIDLMCGFPDESLKEVEQTVRRGLSLPISHLSVYPFRPTAGTVLRRRIAPDKINHYLAKQKASFSLARRMVAAAGFTEYASGYFGRPHPALNIVMPFQLRLETVGFGSGAVSMLDRQYHGHSKGFLSRYVEDPLQWDFSAAVTAPAVTASLMNTGLSIFDGVLREEWEFQTGVTLEAALAEPELAPLMSYLRAAGNLIEDDRGIRLPQQSASDTLLNLTFRRSMAQSDPRASSSLH